MRVHVNILIRVSCAISFLPSGSRCRLQIPLVTGYVLQHIYSQYTRIFSTDKYRENSDRSVATWPKKSLKSDLDFTKWKRRRRTFGGFKALNVAFICHFTSVKYSKDTIRDDTNLERSLSSTETTKE